MLQLCGQRQGATTDGGAAPSGDKGLGVAPDHQCKYARRSDLLTTLLSPPLETQPIHRTQDRPRAGQATAPGRPAPIGNFA